jgi:hypothetical protein
MSEAPKRSWEEFVYVSRGADPHARQLIEQALDQIAAAPDGEGIALLRKAMVRNGGEPVPIRATNFGSGVMLQGFSENPVGYYVSLDLTAIANLTFEEGGIQKPVSVMGMLVHELYHVADDKTHLVQTTLARLSFVQAGIGMQPLHPELEQTIREEAAQTLKDIRENRFFASNPEQPYDSRKYPALAAFSQRLLEEVDAKWGPSKHAELLVAIGAERRGGAEKQEEDATRYTDAFMQKSGCSEPWRGEYYNSRRGEGRTQQQAHNPSCSGRSPSLGFSAVPLRDSDIIDELDVPRVKPHQPERAAPTRFQ